MRFRESLDHRPQKGKTFRDTSLHTSNLDSFRFEDSFFFCCRARFYMHMYRAVQALLPPNPKSCYMTVRFPPPYPFPYSRLPKRRGPESQSMLFLPHPVPKGSVTIAFVKVVLLWTIVLRAGVMGPR